VKQASRDQQPTTFFQPAAGFVGDVIPFLYNGAFHLFYLHEDRDDPDSGTPWGLAVTEDFVTFEDLGDVLPSGGASAPDFNAYTGSVVAGDGVLHLFYTGHNPKRLGPDGVTPVQVVLHAISNGDATQWSKLPADTFEAPTGYEPGDWRDPFVFRVPGEDTWRMLLAARHDEGPARRRGVVAQLRSRDLTSWQMDRPFWNPGRYITQECPDVFEWNGWWYLVYSEFSESFTARYRVAPTPDGPWSVPVHDTVDGRAFYAPKTVARDGRRFFVGWIATREDSADDGAWQWAGTMSVLEALQEDDGSLRFRLPSEVLDQFNRPQPLHWRNAATGVGAAAHQLRGDVPDGLWTAVTDELMEQSFRVTVEVDIEPDTRECGVLLRSTTDGDGAYIIRLEPQRNRMVFDRWPRRITGPMQWQISGDVPHVTELERPCALPAGRHKLDIVVDGTVCVAVLDESVSLSTRIYDRTEGHLGLFVGEGRATFPQAQLLHRSNTTRKEAQ